MKTGCSVRDCMTTKPVSIDSSATIDEVSRAMDANKVGSLVVKDNDRPVTIITEQDVVRKFIAKGVNPQDKCVKDMDIENLITISPDADLYEAIVKMKDNNIRHLPVMEQDDLIGLLTIKDVLKIEPALFDTMIEKFELREEERKLKALEKQINEEFSFH